LSLAPIVILEQLTSFSGIVANSTGRVLPHEPMNTPLVVPGESDSEDAEDEEATEPVKILEAVATFDEVTVWAHDQIPAADDIFVKGIEEWIAFAEAIHSTSRTEEPSNKSSD
jgi:ribonuclease H2 subunit C